MGAYGYREEHMRDLTVRGLGKLIRDRRAVIEYQQQQVT